MAMLAEKRKRVKYCLNPNGNQWQNDDNKFGQKLLEKMGWQKGQGLGANNQGITERLKVAYKFDSTGLGFKEKDGLLQQQNNFQNLLLELNSNTKDIVEEQPVVSSLEEKSKKSKSRVHYKKFTRGKDISRYSSKDLKSILGTGVENNCNMLGISVKNTGNLIYGGSMNAYFEKKFLKNEPDSEADVKNEYGSCTLYVSDMGNTVSEGNGNDSQNNECKEFTGKKEKNTVVKQENEVYDAWEAKLMDERKKEKKSKKKKVVKMHIKSELETFELDLKGNEGIFETNCHLENESAHQECDVDALNERNLEKKSKKRKGSKISSSEKVNNDREVYDVCETYERKKQKKSKKKKDATQFVNELTFQEDIDPIYEFTSCSHFSDEIASQEIEIDAEPGRKKRKKSKKRKDVEEYVETLEGQKINLPEQKKSIFELNSDSFLNNKTVLEEGKLDVLEIKNLKKSRQEKNVFNSLKCTSKVSQNDQLISKSISCEDKENKLKKFELPISIQNPNEETLLMKTDTFEKKSKRKNHEKNVCNSVMEENVDNGDSLVKNERLDFENLKPKRIKHVKFNDFCEEIYDTESVQQVSGTDNSNNICIKNDMLDYENLKPKRIKPIKLNYVCGEEHDIGSVNQESRTNDLGVNILNDNDSSLCKQCTKRKENVSSVEESCSGEVIYGFIKNEPKEEDSSNEKETTRSAREIINPLVNSLENHNVDNKEDSKEQKKILDSYMAKRNEMLERKRLQREFKMNAIPEFGGFVGANWNSLKGYGKTAPTT